MARPRKVVAIDDKIAKAQEDVAKYKEKYSAAVAELKDLLAQKEAEKREKLLDAIEASDWSYDEIMEVLKNKPDEGE